MPLNVDRVRLVAVEPCEPCDGVGEVPSEDWVGFYAWAHRQGLAEPHEHAEEYFLGVCDFDAVPPMRTGCDACDGTGDARLEVALSDVLELVLEAIDRPLLNNAQLNEAVQAVRESLLEAAGKSRGLKDADEAGSWLRVVQEAGEALRILGEQRPGRAT